MWLIKILGLGMVFAACTLTGASKVKIYFNRYKSLKLIVDILTKAKSDISLKNDTLSNSIKESLRFIEVAKDKKGYEFLKYICQEEILTKALTGEQKELFNSCILDTFATTRQEESERLFNYINEFKIFQDEAKRQYDEKKKLYFGLGVYSGLALVIFLI